jgi:hypothetical protein
MRRESCEETEPDRILMTLPIRFLAAFAVLAGMAAAWAFWWERWKAQQGIVRTRSDGSSGDGGGWLDSWGGSDSGSCDSGGDGGSCD